MARKARIKSSTGIYHVLVRAISDLSLFTDEEDIQYYTTILNDLQLQGRCQIYAYALFPTHVHLLIREATPTSATVPDGSPSGFSATVPDGSPSVNTTPAPVPDGSPSVNTTPATVPDGSPSGSEPIGSIMKRIASAYSYYFNVKYEHYGPIYLDRFKSNPVETRDYFLKVLNHIGSQQTDHKYTTNHIPSGLSQELSSSSSLSLLEFRAREKRITDSKLLAFLQQNYSFTNIGEFLQRPEEDIKATIKAAKQIGGSIRQITRLTGSPYQYVFSIRV